MLLDRLLSVSLLFPEVCQRRGQTCLKSLPADQLQYNSFRAMDQSERPSESVNVPALPRSQQACAHLLIALPTNIFTMVLMPPVLARYLEERNAEPPVCIAAAIAWSRYETGDIGPFLKQASCSVITYTKMVLLTTMDSTTNIMRMCVPSNSPVVS